MTHGQPALVLPASQPCALVLRGQPALRPGAASPAPWQRRGRGGRAERLGPQLRSVRKQNFFYDIKRNMMSLPLSIRTLKATESRLQSIYEAARLGLHGETLALAAGMLPQEYLTLCNFDPVVGMAALKGKADGEREMAEILHNAARNGDAKAALEILKHQHGWVAKQAITVEVNQRISITQALEQAEMRVINAIDYLPT